jgi:hypothetical protein
VAKKRRPMLLKRKKTLPTLLSQAKPREARDAHLTGEPLMGDPAYFYPLSFSCPRIIPAIIPESID